MKTLEQLQRLAKKHDLKILEDPNGGYMFQDLRRNLLIAFAQYTIQLEDIEFFISLINRARRNF